MADNLTITIDGIDQLFAKLGKLEGTNVLRPPMDAVLTELETYMEFYPPPPDAIQGPAIVPIRTFTTKGGKTVRMLSRSASGKGVSWGKASSLRYKRTGKLGQRWANGKKVRASGDGIEGTLTNNIDYAPYVQSKALQAKVHQGRWRTDQMAIDHYLSWIVQTFNDAIAAALK